MKSKSRRAPFLPRNEDKYHKRASQDPNEGGGVGVSLGHRETGEALIVCDTDKRAEFTHRAIFWRGVLYLSSL